MVSQTIKAFWTLSLAAVVFLNVVQACQANEPAEVLLVGQEGRRAVLVAIEEPARLRFRDAEGDDFIVSCDDVVRWSTPAKARSADEVLLIDGSRICLAAAWGGEPSVVLEGKKLAARTGRLGRAELNRKDVRAVVWGLPHDAMRRTAIVDELAQLDPKATLSDLLLLANGDRYSGDLIAIGPLSDGEQGQSAVTFRSGLGELVLPVNRVRGLLLHEPRQDPSAAGRSRTPAESAISPPTRAGLLASLKDGSVVAVQSITGDGDEVVLQSALLGNRRLRISDLASIQSLAERLAYLSDREPGAYDFQPYLNLAWPYRPDRSVLGGPLIVDGRIYLKGLGVHSGATLTYPLDGRFDRFAATAAVDDASEGGGSAVVRVLLQDGDGTWAEAFATGTLLGGEAAEQIVVPLGDAAALQLVIEYSHRGDERDYVDLLDARLERTPDVGGP